MAQKNLPKKAPVLSKKQTVHLRRDQIQSRWLLGIFSGILMLIVGVLVYGYIRSYVLRANEPMAMLYGEPITVAEFQKEVRYQRFQLMEQAARFQALANDNRVGTSENYYDEMVRLFKTTLTNYTSIGDDARNYLVELRVAEHEAAKLGITVSAQEVQDQINSEFSFIPEATLTAMPLATKTLTRTPTSTSTPAAGETPSPTATASATPTQTATLEGPVTPTATSTPYTEDLYRQNYADYLKRLQQLIGFSEQDYLDRVRADVLIRKVKEAITGDISRMQEHQRLQRIRLADKETALTLRETINTEADWNAAVQSATLEESAKEDNGEMGWYGPGTALAGIANQVASLQIGGLTEPIFDGTYYYLYRLAGREMRELNDNNYNEYKEYVYRNWLEEQKAGEAQYILLDQSPEIIPHDPSL